MHRYPKEMSRTKGEGKVNDNQLGEVRIKYTDCSKARETDNVQQLWRDPGLNRTEAVEIKVGFAMASGETQNFSVPIYSGTFSFKCIFSNKEVSPFTFLIDPNDVLLQTCRIFNSQLFIDFC